MPRSHSSSITVAIALLLFAYRAAAAPGSPLPRGILDRLSNCDDTLSIFQNDLVEGWVREPDYRGLGRFCGRASSRLSSALTHCSVSTSLLQQITGSLCFDADLCGCF